MNIITDFNGYFWCAIDRDTYDGAPDSHPAAKTIGHGKTEQEAIENLQEKIEDWQEMMDLGIIRSR